MRNPLSAVAAAVIALVVAGAGSAEAQVATLPAGFRVQEIPTNGTSLHVRIGGKGPAVAKGKLTMPILAIGGDHSFGARMAAVMRFAASNVTEGIVPNSGHWIMEENPTATIALVTSFLAK